MTPSAVMYADLKAFANITFRDTARILLSPDTDETGMSLRQRVDDRTFLSRNIVHAVPGSIPSASFSDTSMATQTLLSRIAAARGNAPETRDELSSFLQGPSCDRMCEALDACERSGTLYRNAVRRIGIAPMAETQRCLLLLMLFIATGCLGDPAVALSQVESFASTTLHIALSTMETTASSRYKDPEPQPTRDEALALLRIKDGAACPPLHPLAATSTGTVIGSMATGAYGISDVDIDVSREHLRIWREDDRWWVQGMGSTNGSSLMDGASRTMRVIEPSVAERTAEASDAETEAACERETCDGKSAAHADDRVELHSGDVLYLGATTRFLVISITS